MFNRKARAISGLRAVLEQRNKLLYELTSAATKALQELEAQDNEIADEARVNDILTEAFNAQKLQMRVVAGENEKLLAQRKRLQAMYTAALIELEDLREAYEPYNPEPFDQGETWGLDIGPDLGGEG